MVQLARQRPVDHQVADCGATADCPRSHSPARQDHTRLRLGLVRDFVQALPRQNLARGSFDRSCAQEEVSLTVGKQVATFPTTIEEIMNTREFALGVIDGRAGRGHRSDYATWDTD